MTALDRLKELTRDHPGARQIFDYLELLSAHETREEFLIACICMLVEQDKKMMDLAIEMTRQVAPKVGPLTIGTTPEIETK